ncbi:DUF3794 domain-containing protein [Clostridium tarantellae]|uniref:DUF3794 domain-containing protein n=1 Tax=Clostridium tarantellae TaxID=39493 RepID=A0A6I1MVP4_9CLOT|nr:DUF3794 domain-containing protein [Clostridium tarantellae]MPQ44249.1 DUF3794 domain-containing protein [Clostridium tarantellae]
MYCVCSNKNNYEVISLCDLKKFTAENGPFNNSAWIESSVGDVLILDCNKPNIEKIEKVFVTVNITTTKIIQTPISSTLNSEGIILTGKKLLIDGFICSKIVYTSLTKEQSVYSSDFTIPFCTYIVLEKNTNTFNDKYCIKICIEDVFLSIIDCKTIFQNVTLFLLAKKTFLTCPNIQPSKENCSITNIQQPPPPPPPDTLINNIILNDLNDDSVIIISFNKVNMTILVDSTGRVTDINGGLNYFRFTLYKPDGLTEKITNKLVGNSNGMNFSNNISNTKFQNGDIIKLQYEENSKVIITNFPNTSTPIYIPKNTEESFVITKNGLVAYIPTTTIPTITIPTITTPIVTLSNEILIVNSNNTQVSKVGFDMTNNRLLVTSFGTQIVNPDNRAMILFYLRDSSTGAIKYSSFISSNQNASQFVADLNHKIFNLNDFIELGVYSVETAKVTNFPMQGTTHTVDTTTQFEKTSTEFFQITSTKLQAISPQVLSPPSKLPNNIEYVFTTSLGIFDIFFNTLSKTLYANLTPSGLSSGPFTLKLIDKDQTTIVEKNINPSDRDVAPFIYEISNLFFDFHQVLELTFDSSKTEIIVHDIPKKGDIYVSSNDTEYFEITPSGLVPYTPPPPLNTLPNEILIINSNNIQVSKVGFDMTNNRLLVTSFGAQIVNLDNRAMILFYLRDGSTGAIKHSSFIPSNQNASQFVADLNHKIFNLNDFIELGVYNVGTAKVTNFPMQGATHIIDTTTQIEKTSTEFFQITSTKLQSINPQTLPNPSKLQNNIEYVFTTSLGIFDIFFNTLSKTLYANLTPSGLSPGTFSLKLIDKNQKTIIEKNIAPSDTDVVPFIYKISNLFFEFNQVLELKFDSSKTEIIVNDIPNKGDIYVSSADTEYFEITPTGLTLYKPSPITL